MDKLTDTQRDDALTRLSDWQAQGDAIVRTFKFRDFVRAIDFVNAMAEMAEEVNHHPDIDIRYNRVTIALTTHDAGAVDAGRHRAGGRDRRPGRRGLRRARPVCGASSVAPSRPNAFE